MTKKYYRRYPQGWSTQYDIGVATTREAAEEYEESAGWAGWERCTRETAIKMLRAPYWDHQHDYDVRGQVNGGDYYSPRDVLDMILYTSLY